jgi:hypothetical protein
MAELGLETIDGSLPETLAAIINGVIEAETLRDRHAVENTLRLVQGLREIAEGAPPEVIAQKIAEIGLPRFYQTALLRIVVQLALSLRRSQEIGGGLGLTLAAVTIDARYAAKYENAVAAASTVEVEMVPTAPPEYLRQVLEPIQAQLPPAPVP